MNNCEIEIDVKPKIFYKAVKWCREALSGIWSYVNDDEVVVKPLSGGLSSVLYLCSIKSHLLKDLKNGEPTTVVLRIYSEMAHKTEGFIAHNNLVSVIMAERHFGPKIYALFPEARIEQFIQATKLHLEDVKDSKISAMIARKMALYHTMDMPLPKQPKWLFHYMNVLVMNMNKYLVPSEIYEPSYNQLIEILISYDIEKEVSILKGILSKVPSPVVFCHNDIQRGNILYQAEALNSESSLTFIDFEYSHYSWRGTDWGNYFNEWCWDYDCCDPPYFAYNPENYPNYDEKAKFIRAYMEALGEYHLTNEVLSDLCYEADVYSLAANILWCLWSITMAFTSNIKFDYMQFAVEQMKQYERMKKHVGVS